MSDRRAGAQAALDVLLTDAASGDGFSRRLLAPRATAKVAFGLARRPGAVLRRSGALGAELARVALGRSECTPAKGDRRFGDEAWSTNWLLRRTLQSYLAVGETTDGLLCDADLDWYSERQARFAVSNVLDALAPSNFPWSNPAVLRETVDQGGANFARGARRLVVDLSRPPRLPASVDTSGFSVGENLASTDGAVVLRTEVFELLHYAPCTPTVREVPLLFVPPTINKYYILDLAPGRSFVAHLLQQGMQVFVMSWRNPGAEQGGFDLDTYVAAVLAAREAVAEITGSGNVHVNGACSGGILSAAALGHLAARGELGAVASLTLTVAALDTERAGTATALLDREAAAGAIAESARRGYVDGKALAGVFAWLRPNDLIWGYVVNNYLLGKPPPAFDILFWNQDTVRMSAGLHRDFIRLSLDNALARPGALTALDEPVDLAAVGLDAYVVAGQKDHIVPWENCYRSARLLGGRARFVLAESGHIQTVVNPPAKEAKGAYHAGEELPDDPEAWLAASVRTRGSWWPDHVAWLHERSGGEVPAPEEVGSDEHPPLAVAPGSYVFAD